MINIDNLGREFATYLFCDLIFGTKSDYVNLLFKFPGRIETGYDFNSQSQNIAMELVYKIYLQAWKLLSPKHPGASLL